MKPILYKDSNSVLFTTKGDRVPVKIENYWGRVGYKLSWKERFLTLWNGKLWYSVYCKHPTPVFEIQVGRYKDPVSILVIEQCSHTRLVSVQAKEGFNFYGIQEKVQGLWELVPYGDSINLYKTYQTYRQFVIEKEKEIQTNVDAHLELCRSVVCEN